MKIYALKVRSRAMALLLVAGAVVAGIALLTVGLVLLAILVIAAAVLALGAAIYYRIRGRRGTRETIGRRRATGLDPAQEIFVQQPRRLREEETRDKP